MRGACNNHENSRCLAWTWRAAGRDPCWGWSPSFYGVPATELKLFDVRAGEPSSICLATLAHVRVRDRATGSARASHARLNTVDETNTMCVRLQRPLFSRELKAEPNHSNKKKVFKESRSNRYQLSTVKATVSNPTKQKTWTVFVSGTTWKFTAANTERINILWSRERSFGSRSPPVPRAHCFGRYWFRVFPTSSRCRTLWIWSPWRSSAVCLQCMQMMTHAASIHLSLLPPRIFSGLQATSGHIYSTDSQPPVCRDRLRLVRQAGNLASRHPCLPSWYNFSSQWLYIQPPMIRRQCPGHLRPASHPCLLHSNRSCEKQRKCLIMQLKRDVTPLTRFAAKATAASVENARQNARLRKKFCNTVNAAW